MINGTIAGQASVIQDLVLSSFQRESPTGPAAGPDRELRSIGEGTLHPSPMSGLGNSPKIHHLPGPSHPETDALTPALERAMATHPDCEKTTSRFQDGCVSPTGVF